MIGPTWRAAAAVAVLVAPGAVRAAAEPYHNTTYHFSVEPPAGWRVMDPEKSAEVKETFEGDITLSSRFVVGFCPATPDPTVMAIVLYDRIPMNGLTAELVERYVCDQLPVVGPGGTLNFPQENRPGVRFSGYDRTRHRAFLRLNRQDPETDYDAKVGAHVGAEGVVMVAFVVDGKYDRYARFFDQMNDTVRFDDGYTFTPLEPPQPVEKTILQRVLDSHRLKWGLVVVGLVIGGMIVQLVAALRRR